MMSLLTAYVDPAAGGMLLQIIVGSLLAVAMFLKAFWHRILSLFGIRRDKPAAVESAPVKAEAETADSAAPPKDPS